MKKTLIALAVAALVAPGLAAAEGATVSGLANISFTGAAADAAKNTSPAKTFDKTDATNQFGALAEINVVNDFGGNVTGRVDIDFALSTNTSTDNAAKVEQAFFAYKAMDNLNVIGGVFNNPLNYEHQDAGARTLNSQGQIAKIFDGQTGLYQNNVAGVVGAMNLGMATVNVGVLDQLSHGSSNNNAQNSFVGQVVLAPMEGLNVKAGYVTQNKFEAASVPTTAGNVWDVNAEFKTGALKVAAEFVGAEEIIDLGAALYGSFMINEQIGVGARYDTVSYKKVGTAKAHDDTTTVSLNGSYQVAKNLKAALEYRSDDNGTKTDDSVRVNFLVKY